MKLLFFSFFAIQILALTTPVLAQTPPAGANQPPVNTGSVLAEALKAAGYTADRNITDPRAIAVNIVNTVLSLFGIVFVGLLIYGGWLWMTAAGNQDRVDKSKKVILWAVIGIAIVMLSLVISVFVSNTLIDSTNVGPIGS